jgi:uncharacterized protein YqgC (DUF456 family)
MNENLTIILTLIVMVLILPVSLIPFVPGPALMWGAGILFAALNKFERVPLGAVVIMTFFMLLGSTSEFWLRYLGLRGRGGSCLSFVGSLLGGIIGTLVIPIPIVGTLIGAILGALAVEFLRVGQIKQASQAGLAVFEMYLVNIVIEFCLSLAIFSTFAFSLYLTA